MTDVPLRSYLYEIEKSIENGLIDQAIAHIRHILENYPKYLDAYRLLGKAYLESQRYTDAGDIFQRVLSSIPDDFVSQAGMSIIREDEGNLDQAILHMERAYEVQPANNAIQDELRRLYGRRDNIEPYKIRLTRGALARLYLKGELYQQAIGEILTALKEDPDRLDLQALLADVYYRIDRKAEAAETAQAVLERLPNCLSAIRIMIQVLTETSHDSERNSYLQRLFQLDPYAEFATAGELNSAMVPEQVIKIEKLDWKPEEDEAEADQIAWAGTLGADTEKTSVLSDIKYTQQSGDTEGLSGKASENTDETQAIDNGDESGEATDEDIKPAEISPPSGELPDWMAEIGWQPADLSLEGDPQFDIAELQEASETDESLAKAEIPDWLAALAPSSLPEYKFTPTSEEDASLWLDEAEPPDFNETPGRDDKEVEIDVQESEGLPDWLMEVIEPPNGLVSVAEQSQASSLPDEDAQSAEEQTVWDLEQPAHAETAEGTTEIPEWLFESEEKQPETLGDSLKISQGPAGGQEIPDWLIEPEAADEIPPRQIPIDEASAEKDAFLNWLLGTDIPSEEAVDQFLDAEIPSELVQTSRQAFDEKAPSEGEPTPQDTQPVRTVVAELSATESSTDIDQGEEASIGEALQEAIPADMGSEKETSVDAEPFEGPPVEIPLTEELLFEAALRETMPAEVGFEKEALEEAGMTEETSIEAKTVEEIFIPAELSEPPPFATAHEDEISVKAELSEEAAIEEAPEKQLSTEPKPEIDEMQEAFAWLMGLKTKAPETQPIDRLPFGAQPPEPSGVVDVDLRAEAAGDEIAAEASPDQPIPISEGKYDLLGTAEESSISEEVLADEDAAYAWLESLAVKQGSSEALSLKPVDRQETVPDGLKQEKPELEESVDLISAEPPQMAPSEEIDKSGWEEAAPASDEEPTAIVEPVSEEFQPPKSVSEEPEEAVAEIPPLPEWLSEMDVSPGSEEPGWTPPQPTPRLYNINEASLSELEGLPGIGFVLAQRIIEFRSEHGPFESLEDALLVPGFSLEALDGVREFLFAQVSTTEAVLAPAKEGLSFVEAEGASEELIEARRHISEGRLNKALSLYSELIHSGKELEQVAQDLQNSLNHFPNEVDLWQNLGDALLRLGKVQEAIQAFIKAEQLLG